MPVEWITRLVERHVVRQPDGQVLALHGHHTAIVAVHNWDWAAPVALPRDAPVA